MPTVQEIRNTLWEKFNYLTDDEIIQIWDEMYNFWEIMLED